VLKILLLAPRGEQEATSITWLTEEVWCNNIYSEMKTNKSSEMKTNFLWKWKLFYLENLKSSSSKVKGRYCGIFSLSWSRVYMGEVFDVCTIKTRIKTCTATVHGFGMSFWRYSRTLPRYWIQSAGSRSLLLITKGVLVHVDGGSEEWYYVPGCVSTRGCSNVVDKIWHWDSN
jgi:hypothetical protein